jgi:hypothetical protein
MSGSSAADADRQQPIILPHRKTKQYWVAIPSREAAARDRVEPIPLTTATPVEKPDAHGDTPTGRRSRTHPGAGSLGQVLGTAFGPLEVAQGVSRKG